MRLEVRSGPTGREPPTAPWTRPGAAISVVSRSADVEVGCGTGGTDVPTDWYFPQPNNNRGLVWVQHGFSRANNHFEELSTRLAEEGYVVFATSLAPGTAGCAMNNEGFLTDFARLFPDRHDPAVGLLKSARAAATSAGISLADLPDSFAFTGHSAGAGSIVTVARKLLENHAATAASLAGLVLLDPVEGAGTSLIADGTPTIAAAGIRAHTISSPGYSCNSSANGTVAFVAALARPFAGVRLTSGAHCDAEASSSDFLCTAFCGNPQAENVAILQALTKGWIADAFDGTTNGTNYPGGAYYQSEIANGRIVTLPESNCANGTTDAGEECDDGNRFDGDCCSGFCRFESPGSACAADANLCTDDVCNGTGQCTHPNNAAACDDGSFCTVGDVCSAGACMGAARDCSGAGDACNTGICDESTDTCIAQPKSNGTGCDDGNACTQLDRCEDGLCQGTAPVVCNAASQCHDAGACDPASGDCTNPAKSDGTACDDGDACTVGDTCQDGGCAPGVAVVCTALDACHGAGVCEPSTGQCSQPALPDGSACSDGDPCTLEECRSGQCTDVGTPCGDGLVQAGCGETCDDGAANGTNDCCSLTCELVDGDADTLCDRDDPCTGPTPLAGARLRVKGLGEAGETAGLVFKGTGLLPYPFDPPLNPAANGLRLLVDHGGGGNWVDISVPGGDYSSTTRSGWTTASGGRWKYFDRSRAAGSLLQKLSVRDRSGRTPGEVEVALKGRVPGVVLENADLPLTLTVVLEPPVSPLGQCAATTFDPEACSLSRSATSLQCR